MCVCVSLTLFWREMDIGGLSGSEARRIFFLFHRLAGAAKGVDYKLFCCRLLKYV